MRTAGCMQRVQTEQYRTLIHHFPEDFVCKEPFHEFTDPFRYVPHPAVTKAARLVIENIESDQALSEAFAEGKMLGVLVCSIPEDRSAAIPGTDRKSLLYLAAFSGNVGGRSHIDGFVPPIFDLLDPSGHFKEREAEITELNHKINTLSNSEQMASLESDLQAVNEAKETSIADFRMQMAQSRVRREEIRNGTSDQHVLAGLIKESQFEKAELKRLKTAWDKKIADIKVQIQILRDEISELKVSRARMSDQLQDWIFRQYIVHNSIGERSSIADIFASHGLTPPGGTGECAAPKLLEHAYRNGLQPLAMGEFWYGKSPDTAVRTQGNFYPSCTSKCGPLLDYMLRGLLNKEMTQLMASPKIVYEDDDIVVAEKPSGMPSVPGLDGRLSLEEYLTGVTAAHRLDMDTSGVMVFAKNTAALTSLHRQFEDHTVRKTYMARISAPDNFQKCIDSGSITLPLSPDHDERPRQKVDFRQGKPAHTDYEVVQTNSDGTADLLLHPHTGRTHQLRVHCAHTLGLGRPIIGDLLYGGWSVKPACIPEKTTVNSLNNVAMSIHPSRLHLHALSITFRHPVTGEELTFTSHELCY